MSEDNLLPPNASELQNDIEETTAFRLGNLDFPNRYLLNPEKCPENLLPWLAWSLSVDYWDKDWAIETRRAVIKASLEIHRQKGTIGALKKGLEAFGFDYVDIEEWFNYEGTPYHFKASIELLTANFDLENLNYIDAVIKNSKNVRSHLESLSLYLTTKTEQPFLGIGFVIGEKTSIYPKQLEEIEISNNQNFIGCLCVNEDLTIYPKQITEVQIDNFKGLASAMIIEDTKTIYPLEN